MSKISPKVKPLYDLLKGKSTKKPVKKGGKVEKVGQKYNSREKIEWGEEQQVVLDELINCLMSPEVIAFPDFNSPFFVNTDASNQGLGAVLYQRQGNVDRVISYASRTLSEAEKKYHLHSGKLEFLALNLSMDESLETIFFDGVIGGLTSFRCLSEQLLTYPCLMQYFF